MSPVCPRPHGFGRHPAWEADLKAAETQEASLPRGSFRFLRIGIWVFATPIIAIAFFALATFITLQIYQDQETVDSQARIAALERLQTLTLGARDLALTHASLVRTLDYLEIGGAPNLARQGAQSRLQEIDELMAAVISMRDGADAAGIDEAKVQDTVDAYIAYRARVAAALDQLTEESVEATESAFAALVAVHDALIVAAAARARQIAGEIKLRAVDFSWSLILVLSGSVLVALLVSSVASLRLSQNLGGIIQAMTGLAQGRQDLKIPGVEREDEVGDLARATMVFAATLRQVQEEVQQRERTEAALRAERNFVSAINETVGALILVLDRNGRIVRFNRICEETTGLGLGEVVGTRPWDRMVAPEDRELTEHMISQLDASRPRIDFEASCTTPDGGSRLISWSNTTLLDAEGQIEFVICCGIDISQRKFAEERLRQAHRMEAVGQLTGGIAHDFNNLLAVILIDLDLVLRRLDGDEHGRRMVEHAIRAGQRGASLTNQLLSFSRQQPLRPEILHLEPFIANIAGLLSGVIGEGIRITSDHQEGLWTCEVDSRQLAEALINLSNNARDAMPNGGELRIETRNRHLSEDDLPLGAGAAPGDFVELALHDSGCGIPDDLQAHIFEPFFTTKEVGEGSGLGLSMVYGFMRQSQGLVTVTSAAGQGTAFRLYFPRVEESEAQADESDRIAAIGPVNTAGSDATRILLVEDDPDLRGLTRVLLEGLGYEVIEAANGSEALDVILSSEPVDVLFSDLTLPWGPDGRETAARAREIRPGLKVLFMTGYPRAVAFAGEPMEGELGVLQKPFRKADLEQALKKGGV